MGQATSTPVSRGANGPSSRRISRLLQRGDGAGDDDGGPHTQEELEAPTPGPHCRTTPGDHHLDDNPHIAQGHRLVRAHHPQPEQAPSTAQTGQATGSNRSPEEDRMGSTAMAQSTEAAPDPAAATGKAPGPSGQEEAAPPTLAQVQASTPASATPAPSTCSAQSMEQSRECILDSPSPAATSSATPSAPVPSSDQSLEQHRERILDPPSATSPSTAATTAPVPPITTVESLQSALANAHAATTDSVAPTITPTLSSSALPSVSPQHPLAPSPTSSIPRPLPLGTTMIVQGLVQTIEVSRLPRTTPATTNEPNETRPLEKEPEETNSADVSEASGSSPRGASTVVSPDSNDTNDAPSNITTSSDNTATNDASTTPTTPNTTPRTPTSRTSPSSTDVLGLLLSIAAQATAEALVPWSVPPRSRSTSREGIASGLAAAFSALAGAGAGVTATNAGPGPAPTISEPIPRPQPIIRPLSPPQPVNPEPQSSRRFSGLSTRRFSRLSISPGRISSLSSRRLSALIPGRGDEHGRRVSAPASPTPRRASSAPVSQPPRRGVLGRIERWVPRRLRRDSGARSATRASSPAELPLDEPADFGRAPPSSTLPVPALPESSVSPLPSPPLSAEPPTISVPAPTSSPVSTITVPPPSSNLSLPPSTTPSTLSATPTTDAEELVRFSQMLGFTPGIVHPAGSFERFLSDMQDELRVALGEYQERIRSRNPATTEGSGGTGNEAGPEGEDEVSRMAARLDHTRPHVHSTDPLPLNWWRMYRFPALPDGNTTDSTAETTPATTADGSPATTTETSPATSAPTTPAETPTPTDTESSQPIHPAIIIGLRSVSRDPTEETTPSSPSESENDRARSSERGDRVRSFESGDRVRSRHRRLRLGEDEERRTRDGTRNYIIWIIGGYYPSNHPLLAHPNLFLGQVHPDELWMLNEFLGQVKPPTATPEDIAKAGLRVVKGTDIKALAQAGEVTENCTERCLICLDDYEDIDDLRIMNCKHMFHQGCVDRWMETGRNSCPACRTKGVDTTPTPAPESSPTPVS